MVDHASRCAPCQSKLMSIQLLNPDGTYTADALEYGRWLFTQECTFVRGVQKLNDLVDFDMPYGHRRNVKGYKDALEEFDNYLPEIISNLKDKEILIITADHGCDPTYKGTDHTREYIPILVYGKGIKNVDLGIRSTFADIAATIEELLLGNKVEGSFAKELF